VADEEDPLVVAVNRYFARVGIADQPCPMCKTNDWGVAGPVALPMTMTLPNGAETYGLSGISMVMVICNRCGFTRMFPWKLVKEASGPLSA
jgi:hypothetical protein